jgi:hypothetical protein
MSGRMQRDLVERLARLRAAQIEAQDQAAALRQQAAAAEERAQYFRGAGDALAEVLAGLAPTRERADGDRT